MQGSKCFNLGKAAFEGGFSIQYNPYRNLPADGRYGDWQEGWEAAERQAKNFEPRHNVVN